MGALLENRPLSTFLVVGLVLLFVSGCWTVGSLAVVQWNDGVIRVLLLASIALANISFLASVLISVLGLAAIFEEDQVKRKIAYALAIGMVSLMVSIAAFLCFAAGFSPTGGGFD